MRRAATGEAPGRLDFMGGVADYSGALVLQTPIRATTKVAVSARREPGLQLRSGAGPPVRLPLEPLRGLLRRRLRDEEVAAWLEAEAAPLWTRYPVGCLWVFCRHTGWLPPAGLAFHVRSRVPQSLGVSSSAALEVATLRALGRMAGTRWKGTELARLGQRAENRVVGAPCGLMDQLASVHGRRGHLLPILCRPDVLRDPIPLPRGVIVVGWASGVAHAVGDSPYVTARTATFMGKRLFETHSGRRWSHAAEIPVSLFRRHARSVPDSLTGRAFLAEHAETGDPLSRVRPGKRYRVRRSLRFPIEESFRCGLAAALLRRASGRGAEESLRHAGELMLQSHAGYGDLGLGAPETDAMVDAIVRLGPDRGLYGARVSGGGSGGTVVVLLRRSALPRLEALARRVRFARAPLPLIR